MSETPDRWDRIGSREIADCRIFRVREDIFRRAGERTEHNFFVVENPDWVNIIGLTQDDQVILIEQFRFGTQEITLEIPGGMLDKDEDPETAARRELAEETGFAGYEMIYLGKSHPNPAIQSNTIHHYLALDCEKTGGTSFDEHESVVTKLVPYEEIGGLVLSGAITHALAIAGFYYLALYRDQF